METGASFPGKWDLLGWKFPLCCSFHPLSPPPSHHSATDPRTYRHFPLSLKSQNLPLDEPIKHMLSFGAGLWGLAASHRDAVGLEGPITPTLCFWERVEL